MANAGMDQCKTSFRIVTQTDIAVMQAQLKLFCQANNFSSSETGRVVTAASELCANVIKHATKGELTVQLIGKPARSLNIFVKDNGPGITNIDLAMTNGFSSSGTLGLGLPAVKRMADEFNIRSSKEGTIVAFKINRNRGTS